MRKGLPEEINPLALYNPFAVQKELKEQGSKFNEQDKKIIADALEPAMDFRQVASAIFDKSTKEAAKSSLFPPAIIDKEKAVSAISRTLLQHC
jgi:hypothetical protein